MSDIINKGLNRLVYQFEASENFKGFLTSFLEEYQQIDNANIQLLNDRYLDTAIGAQLDGIGEIVGVDRPKESIDIIGAFGFVSDDTSRGFTTLADLNLGGQFRLLDEGESLIGDDLYRIVIRAKIIKNQSAMTVDDTTRLISFMFGGIEVRYFLHENLKPVYAIGAIISPLEAFLLDNIPILIGLGDISYISYNEDDVFSFSGDPNGQGFTTLADPSLGGSFAKLI